MDTRAEFSDSNEIASNCSSICCSARVASETLPSDISYLNLLSENLDSIFFNSSDFDYFADAKLVLSSTGKEVPVHWCLLSARSHFLRTVFASSKDKDEIVCFELKDLAKDYEVGLDAAVVVLGYLYSGKVRSLPKEAFACADDDCSHTTCRPALDFMLQVLYVSLTFQVSELVAFYEEHLLEILHKVAIDDILVVLSVANTCRGVCQRLLGSCIELVVRSDVDNITLDKTLPQEIVKQIIDSRLKFGLISDESQVFPEKKHIKRIHRALDSDDVELVRMLLKEVHTNLDDAHALHYAVAYCDAKTTTELLDLGLADVNARNSRGYTVLHVAAMRKEPKIIVSLLTKGARPSNLTLDGRKALQITKRITKAADNFRSTEEGKASHNDRLCIEILEQAERRDPLLGEASLSLAMADDDLRMKLLYLENRVGLARLLFPTEAKVIMHIAQIDGTMEFEGDGITSNNLPGVQRTTVDLNEAPFKIQQEHLVRMRALSRAVEHGKRFFPRCSEILNKIMDADDLPQLANVGSDSSDELVAKKHRYLELLEVLNKAFYEDKKEFDRSGISSSFSTSKGLLMRPRPDAGFPVKRQKLGRI